MRREPSSSYILPEAGTLPVSLRILQALALAAVAAAVPAERQATRLRAPDVKFVASPQSVVDAMLDLAHVTAADVVYDLGSGDGRIPITAAQRYGARGVGVEIDPLLVRVAADRLAKAGGGGRARVRDTEPPRV